MSKITGKENAYPVLGFDKDGDEFYHPGLTIRQEFAARAMQGLLSYGLSYRGFSMADLADESVKAADALIAELNKTPTP